MHIKRLIGLLAVPMALTALFGTTACGDGEGGKNTHKHENNVNNQCSVCGEFWEYTSGLNYGLNKDGESYSAAYNQNASGDVVLPYYYEGKPVTGIYEYAFSGCELLTDIVIPDSVTSIEIAAFESCSGLTIYCEAESKPNGWNREWNIDDCPVVWGYKGEA